MDEHFAKTLTNNKDKYGIDSGIITKLLFLKHKDKIKELYDEGFSLKAIWVWMKEDNSFPYSYCRFVQLFRKHIEPVYSHQLAQENESTKTSESNNKTSNKSHSKTFDFNPTPNKDELI